MSKLYSPKFTSQPADLRWQVGQLQWCAYQNHNDPIYEVNDLFLTIGFTI